MILNLGTIEQSFTSVTTKAYELVKQGVAYARTFLPIAHTKEEVQAQASRAESVRKDATEKPEGEAKPRPLSCDPNSDAHHVTPEPESTQIVKEAADQTAVFPKDNSKSVEKVVAIKPKEDLSEIAIQTPYITPPQRQRGEVLSAEFKDADGQVFCDEVAERSRTVEILENSLKEQESALAAHLKAGKPMTPEIKARHNQIESNRAALNEIHNSRAKKGKPVATWASTDAPRAHFRKCVQKARSKLLGKSFFEKAATGVKMQIHKETKQKIKQAAEFEAKANSLAVTGNMRYQQTYLVSKEPMFIRDPALPKILEQKDPKGRRIPDPQVITRYNLLNALEVEVRKGGSLHTLEKNLLFKEQIDLLKTEMAADKEGGSMRLESGAQSDHHMMVALIGQLERTPISYQVPDGRGIVRSASISDFMHGETNVEDVKVLIALNKLHGALSKIASESMSTEFKAETPVNEADLVQAYKTSLSDKERHLLMQYYPSAIFNGKEVNVDGIVLLMNKLAKDVSKAYPEKGLDPLNQAHYLGALQEIALERDAHLMEKALQDLNAHLSKHPVAADAQSVFFGRIGLVDTVKDPKYDADGFCLNERSMAMDAASAYRALNGKTIVFDSKGSGLMQDFENPNIIHAPREWAQGVSEGQKPKSVTINASYLNISIAGHLGNDGIQGCINAEGIPVLEEALKTSNLKGEQRERAVQLLRQLQSGILINKKGGKFDTVADGLELMSLLGHASVNCYGGKDRTGYICAVHDNRKMSAHLKAAHPGDKNYAPDAPIYTKISQKMMSYDGLIIGVIRDNTAISAMKLARAKLPLLLDADGIDFFKGVLRIAINGAQSLESFTPKIVKRFFQRVADIKPGEGDLYS